MNTKLLSISLAMITSMLVACGGGGDARSPDRPALRLDPDSLRIKFTNGNSLPGLGDDTAIQVQILGSQTDGIDKNLGPELNVTAGTTWEIKGADLGNPAIAKLADAVRNANQIGTVQDILSKVRLLTTDDTDKTLTISGSYRFNNILYLVKPEPSFTVIRPLPSGDLMIKGPDKIYFDPLDQNPEIIVAKYTLEQGLENTTITENKTSSYRFCASKDDYFKFESYEYYSKEQPREATADAEIDTPFDFEDKTRDYWLDIVAINPSESCADYRDLEKAGTIEPIARIDVQIIPAVVNKVDVCVVVTPFTNGGGNNTCSAAGLLNEAYKEKCKGLDTTSANVPAGSNIQMVAQLNYLNGAAPGQKYEPQYRCFNGDLLSWSEMAPADKKSIYETPLDTTSGNGLLIGQRDFDPDLSSAVIASYKNSATESVTESVTGKLTLNLIEDSVVGIKIIPVTGDTIVNGSSYKIRYNLLETNKEFKAECTYSNGDVFNCGASDVRWSVSGDPAILKVNPTIATQTAVSPSNATKPVDGTAVLTAQYTKNGPDGAKANVTIEILNDPILELHLVQAIDRNAVPIVKKVDEFSCLGSGSPELLNPDDPAQIGKVPGAIQFYAHALFLSGNEGGTNDIDPTNTNKGIQPFLENITDTNSAVKLIAEEGYYDAATKSCVSGPVLDNVDPSLSTDDAKPDDGAGADKPAEFNSKPKGLLEGQGVTRTGTLCVRAIIDLNNDGVYDAPSELISEQGTTVFVQPASDLALYGSAADVCGQLEPVLSSNVENAENAENPLFSPLILPALYNLGSYADPLIANLPTQVVLDALNGGLAMLPGSDGSEPSYGIDDILAIYEKRPDELQDVDPYIEALILASDKCSPSQQQLTTFLFSIEEDPGKLQASLTAFAAASLTVEECEAQLPGPTDP